MKLAQNQKSIQAQTLDTDSVHDEEDSILGFYILVIPTTLELVLDITFSKQYMLMVVSK